MTSSPLALLAAAALTLPAADALAQHCHVPTDAGTPAASSPAAPAVSRLAASFELVAGAADVMDERVAYQGLVLGLGAGWGRLDGRVALPLFHVEDEGTGLGDLVVGASADLAPARAPVRAGLSATISAATGDAASGRGMGHTMVAAGGWLRAARGGARMTMSASYAQAVGEGAEHAAHGHGTEGWPLVDPMNARELVVDGAGTVGLGTPRVRAGLALTYAAPLAHGGATRLVPAALGELVRGALALRARVGVPVIGDPFIARGALEVAVRY